MPRKNSKSHVNIVSHPQSGAYDHSTAVYHDKKGKPTKKVIVGPRAAGLYLMQGATDTRKPARKEPAKK